MNFRFSSEYSRTISEIVRVSYPTVFIDASEGKLWDQTTSNRGENYYCPVLQETVRVYVSKRFTLFGRL